MNRFAAFAFTGLLALLGFLSECASTEKRQPFPDNPDPAGARRLAGDWIFAMKGNDREIDGKLHFAYDGSFVTGSFTEIGGEAQPLSDIRVSKDAMAWKLAGERSVELLAGSFAEDGTLSGTMTRVRKHDEGSGSGDERSGTPGDASSSGYGGHGGHGRHGGGGHRSGGGEGHAVKWTAVPAPKAADEKHD
jgi:hypothetical protein